MNNISMVYCYKLEYIKILWLYTLYSVLYKKTNTLFTMTLTDLKFNSIFSFLDASEIYYDISKYPKKICYNGFVVYVDND